MTAGSNVPTPPGPGRAHPTLQLWKFGRDPLAFLSGLRRDYGDVAHFSLGSLPSYLLSHPDDIRDVLQKRHKEVTLTRTRKRLEVVLGSGLLTSRGEQHRRQRRIMQPAFKRERNEQYSAVMIEFAERACERRRDGEKLEMGGEMMRLTMAVVARVLFAADVEGEAEQLGADLDYLMGSFNKLFSPLWRLLNRLPLPSRYKSERALGRLNDFMHRVIREKRDKGGDGDLLSMLIQARDEDGGAMSDEQIRDEVFTLFAAGHETTATALTWAWYLLARNPEVEKKFHAELDQVLGGESPRPEHFDRLPYTRSVFTEVLRLYPPAWFVARTPLEEFQLRDYRIAPGHALMISQYVTHRDERWFPDPERFLPERWTDEFRANLPRFAYFPFGGGPRQCIGEGFAWMEGVLMLAAIGRRWKFEYASNRPMAVKPLVTLRPRGALPMIARKRR